MKVRTVSTLRPIQAKKVKLELGNRCDRCGLEFPLYILDIMSTSPIAQKPPPESLLVLCVNCRVAVQMGSVTDDEIYEMQRRPPELMKKIAAIVNQETKPYTPPTEYELDELFASAYDSDTFDLFLNGM